MRRRSRVRRPAPARRRRGAVAAPRRRPRLRRLTPRSSLAARGSQQGRGRPRRPTGCAPPRWRRAGAGGSTSRGRPGRGSPSRAGRWPRGPRCGCDHDLLGSPEDGLVGLGNQRRVDLLQRLHVRLELCDRGASLARLELKILFEEVLARMPDIRFASDEPLKRRPNNFITGIEEMPVVFSPGKRSGA